MKTCLACGTDCSTDDSTCANCGEASWSESATSASTPKRSKRAPEEQTEKERALDELDDPATDDHGDAPADDAGGEPAGPVSKKKKGR